MEYFRTSRGWAARDGEDLILLEGTPWVGSPTTTRMRLADSALLAPATPSKIVCVGRNYRKHAEELGNEVPAEPLLFLKPPSSLIGPGSQVRLPPQSERVEHEAELALVIGQRIGPTTPCDPDEAIFGITIANDVTARDLQRRDVQFTRGKGFDTFCVIGPKLVSELGFDDLSISLRVNGELRQDGRTSAMMWGPRDLVSFIGSIMTLEPGDLVLTGTPQGVGPLAAGDEVSIEIDGIGTLSHGVTSPA